jgi:hypothetical protein
MMILFLDLVVFIVIGLLILGFVTQVVIPLYRGTVLFPLFGKSEVAEQVVEAEHTLEELAEAERLKQLNEEINRRKAQLKETE